MSDWDKIISFSNSKQGGAIQFILVCVILVIMVGSYFRNKMGGGGKQRDCKQRGGDKKMGDGSWGGHFFLDSKPLAVLLIILMSVLLVTGGYFAFGGKI